MTKKVGLVYQGGGDFIPGVPARDLTHDEAKKHADMIGANEQATGKTMYIVPRSIEVPVTAGKENKDG